MAARLKHVVYFGYLAHKLFETTLLRRPDFRLRRIGNDDPSLEADARLASMHVYQIPATRDEVALCYRAHRALFKRASQLLIVSSSGAGYDTIDLEDCTRAGILAVNQAGANREAVAEHALGMMLCLSKRIIQSDRTMRRSAILDRTQFMGNDLQGKTLGIVGLGAIGTRLAQLCRGLFAMRILAYDPLVTSDYMMAHGAEPVSLQALLHTSDFVSLHCPLTTATEGLMSADAFAMMQPHAYFITTARGSIHDETALVAALRDGKIAGAGLDVWSKEPPAPNHPLLGFDNVIVSSHTAGVTHEARQNIATVAAEQIIDLFDGVRAPRILNPEVWDVFSERLERMFG